MEFLHVDNTFEAAKRLVKLAASNAAVEGAVRQPIRCHWGCRRTHLGPPVPRNATIHTTCNGNNNNNNTMNLLPNIGLTAEQVHADLSWFPHLKEAFREMNSNAYQVMRGRDDATNGSSSFSTTGIGSDMARPSNGTGPYKQDCLELFGTEFWHDPWPHGLGVVTEAASDELECAWKTTFGTPMADDWKYFNKN
eukprot:scaffold55276_cov55-Attheya_sp.AAC.2